MEVDTARCNLEGFDLKVYIHILTSYLFIFPKTYVLYD